VRAATPNCQIRPSRILPVDKVREPAQSALVMETTLAFAKQKSSEDSRSADPAIATISHSRPIQDTASPEQTGVTAGLVASWRIGPPHLARPWRRGPTPADGSSHLQSVRVGSNTLTFRVGQAPVPPAARS